VEVRGGCHCGNIRFRLRLDPAPARLAARACGCTFCRKHGGLWTSSPQASLRLRVQDEALLHRYRFGTRTAEFLVCRVCGIVPAVTSEIAGRLYAVVSVHACDDLDPAWIDHAPASFDGEGEGERLARRARNWIPEVDIVVAPVAGADSRADPA